MGDVKGEQKFTRVLPMTRFVLVEGAHKEEVDIQKHKRVCQKAFGKIGEPWEKLERKKEKESISKRCTPLCANKSSHKVSRDVKTSILGQEANKGEALFEALFCDTKVQSIFDMFKDISKDFTLFGDLWGKATKTIIKSLLMILLSFLWCRRYSQVLKVSLPHLLNHGEFSYPNYNLPHLGYLIGS